MLRPTKFLLGLIARFSAGVHWWQWLPCYPVGWCSLSSRGMCKSVKDHDHLNRRIDRA